MSDEMGSFRVDVEVENPLRPGERRMLPSVLIDTGAELSWFPAKLLESLGMFGEPEDLILLGSHSLEGLNLQIDPVKKRLVDAGPAPAAAVA
jgi:hypothetical protein